MDVLFKKSKFHGWFIIPSVGKAKGLTMAWHNNIELELISSYLNVCHFQLRVNNNDTLLTCVYGAIEADHKVEQRSHITHIGQQVNKSDF